MTKFVDFYLRAVKQKTLSQEITVLPAVIQEEIQVSKQQKELFERLRKQDTLAAKNRLALLMQQVSSAAKKVDTSNGK